MNKFEENKMKKLMAILVLAGVLSIPSAVFAEASWYGSLRAGVKSSDSNVAVFDGGSRWGIKGSHEAGEGLSAVYRFEHKISTENAGQSSGRLAYVGLSGGFGTVTAGQIWSASYNSFGAVTDSSWFWGNAQTSYRHGQAISYAFSNDLMSLQLDAIYDGGMEMGDAPNDPDLEKVEFGLTVNVGDIGKIAVAHIDDKFTFSNNDTVDDKSDDTSKQTKTNSVAGEISVAGLRVYVGTAKSSTDTRAEGTNSADATESEQKTTFFGFGGGLGDTGISYVFQWRDVKDVNKPWILGVGKSLGGGASMNIEHANNDGGANATRVNLQVNF